MRRARLARRTRIFSASGLCVSALSLAREVDLGFERVFGIWAGAFLRGYRGEAWIPRDFLRETVFFFSFFTDHLPFCLAGFIYKYNSISCPVTV